MSFKSDKYIAESDSGSDTEDVPFQPPKHFSKVKPAPFAGSLEGKEIWLLKVPKNFPLHEVKVLPVSFTATTIAQGPKPFMAAGKSFQVNEEAFSSDVENRKFAVLEADAKGKAFVPSLHAVQRFYNIRETVAIPAIDVDAARVPRRDVEKVANLRMRHFPTGYGAEDYEEAQADAPRVKRAKPEKANKEKSDKSEKSEKSEKKEKKEKKEKEKEKEKKEKEKKEKGKKGKEKKGKEKK